MKIIETIEPIDCKFLNNKPLQAKLQADHNKHLQGIADRKLEAENASNFVETLEGREFDLVIEWGEGDSVPEPFEGQTMSGQGIVKRHILFIDGDNVDLAGLQACDGQELINELTGLWRSEILKGFCG